MNIILSAQLAFLLSTLISAPVTATQVVVPQPVAAPIRLVIPKISVNAPVLAMGLTPDNKMDVPVDFVNAGWFKLGTKPGEKGSAVIGAHVDNGGAIPGLFKNLKNLQLGDTITVLDADNKILNFRVTEIGVYDAETRNTNYVYQRNDKARLNLITCHGEWLPEQNTYTKRLVVFTELVG